MTLCLCPFFNCADDFKHTNVPVHALTSKVSCMITGLKRNHSSYTIMNFVFFFYTLKKKNVLGLLYIFEPHIWASLVTQMVKTWAQSLGWEYPLEKEMATHSSILAWEISWTEEPGGLQPMELQELDTTEWLTHKVQRGPQMVIF